MPISEARKRANRKWDENNKEAKKKITYRSRAKRYIIDMADINELDDLIRLINERKEELKKEI